MKTTGTGEMENCPRVEFGLSPLELPTVNKATAGASGGFGPRLRIGK